MLITHWQEKKHYKCLGCDKLLTEEITVKVNNKKQRIIILDFAIELLHLNCLYKLNYKGGKIIENLFF